MWQLALSTRAGSLLGDLADAHDRTINFGLSTMNSLSFSVRADHPLADNLIDGDALVKAYWKDGSATSVLMMVAEIVTVEESASEGSATVAVTCAEAGYFRLQHRLIGRSAAGYLNGTAATPVNRGTIAANVISVVNAVAPTGVTAGTTTSAGTTAVGPWNYKTAMEALTDLAFAGDGFDFVFDPQEPSGGSVASFRCAATIGSVKANAIFEFGTGQNNVIAYKRQITRDTLLNLGWSLPSGFPDNTAGSAQSYTNAASVTARGTWEGVVSSDLTTDAARLSLVTQHVTLRKTARQRIEFTPGASAPQFITDYSIGDTVTARAEHPANSIRFNAAFRIYGASIAIDDGGLARTTLTLIAD